MTITIATYIDHIRKAIDDIKPTGVSETFSTENDAELVQALEHAVLKLLMILPVWRMDPTVNTSLTVNINTADGSGSFPLPNSGDKYLRFVNLKMTSWKGTVTELMEPGSEEEKRQRTKWGRGTASKPRAMLSSATGTTRKIVFWPGKADDTVSAFTYIPQPTPTSTTITCALREECEPDIINLAASIFLEGKKESELAAKFKQLLS